MQHMIRYAISHHYRSRRNGNLAKTTALADLYLSINDDRFQKSGSSDRVERLDGSREGYKDARG